MYNKTKTHQSNKIEKENENKLRKKIRRNSPTDRNFGIKKESVWERLSKLKNGTSTESVSDMAGPRPNFGSKTFQRLQASKQLLQKQSTPPTRKPLATMSSKRSYLPQRVSVEKASTIPEFEKPTLLQAILVKESANARNAREDGKISLNSKETFGKITKTHNGNLRGSSKRSNESSEDSNEEYTLAPLLTSYNEDISKTCMKTLNNARKFLRGSAKSRTVADVERMTDVFSDKSETRHPRSENTPKLFDDILKTRLQRMLKHEFAVRNALENLDSSVNLQQSFKVNSTESIDKIVGYPLQKKETQKFEVDVIFKNVPSLDKEIEILKALGEKLEATLKNTEPHRIRRDAVSQTFAVATSKSSSVVTNNMDQFALVQLIYEIFNLAPECYAQISAELIGIRHHVGIVGEFRIAQKSIVELKRECHRPFYIPTNSENVQLVKTCFKRLKETPYELLRHVKPKNAQVPFNVLEQDPVFFYHAFNKQPNTSTILPTYSDCSDTSAEDKVDPHVSNQTVACSFKSVSGVGIQNTPTLSEPVTRRKQRIRLRSRVRTKPITNYYCPKNSLLKTILIGFVQMSMFIVFIMALTYPDIRC